MTELEKLAANVNNQLADIREKGATAENVEALKSTIDALKESQIEKAAFDVLKSELLKAQGEIKAMQEQAKTFGKTEGFKTLGEAIEAAVMAQKDTFAKAAKNIALDAPIKIEVATKAVVDMGVGNTIGAGDTQVTITDNTGIVSTIRSRELRYLANVSVGSTSGARALWIEETDEQGTPIFIAEGATKTKISVLYVEKTANVKKIAVVGKVTTEMLQDLPQLISYIQNNLLKRLDVVMENQLIKGNNVDQNLAGSFSIYASAFTGGSLVDQVVAPNDLDVLEALSLQCKEANGIPNAVLMHPSSLSNIKLIKDTTGRPVWKDYVTPNGMLNYSGMNVIETLGLAPGEFMGGDLSVINVLFRNQIGIQIGLSGNDFVENKQTMLAEKRLVQFVSGNDTQVLIKGTFTAAKALIAK